MTPVPDFQMEGLWAALGRLDRMLERATTAADAAASSPSAGEVEPYRGLYITAADVQRLIRRSPGEPSLAGGEPDGASMPAGSRFPWLQQTFGLDAVDLDFVLIALAAEVDLRYERLFAYLQDDVTRRRPTVDLALNLLCASREAKIVGRRRLAGDAPLIKHKLLQVLPDGAGPTPPLLAHYLKLEESVARFLLGQPSLDARLQSIAQLETAPTEPRGVDTEALDQALALLVDGGKPHGYLEGPASSVKDGAVAKLAARLRLPLLTVNLGKAATLGGEFDAVLDALLREAGLLNAVVYLTDFDALLGQERSGEAKALQSHLEATSNIVVGAGERPCGARFTTMTTIAVAPPAFARRRALWAAELRDQHIDLDNSGIDELASRYRLGDAQIREAVGSAGRQAALGRTRPDVSALAKAARIQVARDPGTLAQKIRPFYGWDDLVLPADQIAQLEEVCRQARLRHIVYDDWGFDRKLSLGKGLSALFTGPPGTGKTMAVEVIANDLGLELFKIDLSQVVSKYIGETEKSLDRLFAEARAGNAILFFDECDALFGKRTTVQDAHDRYANIEVAYLLQKLEEHEGLSILATNLRQNLDVGFTRRLSFIIEFPFPDEQSRRRLWQSIWPAQVPRSKDLDLEFMATQFKLPGGAVKNIAVAAAFLAAGDGGELRTEHLLWAARREIEKSGRRVAASEFGPYGAQVEALAAGGAS
jgi:hypothetical protein